MGEKMKNKFYWIAVLILLAENASAADPAAKDYGITVVQASNPATAISLTSSTPELLKVTIASKSKPDDKAQNGTTVRAMCEEACKKLLEVKAVSPRTKNGTATFSISPRANSGSAVLTFSVDGADEMPVKINVSRPVQTLAIKDLEAGKSLDLMAGQEKKIEIEVKEGNVQVTDGTEVQAILDDPNNNVSSLLSIKPLKGLTKNGVATFKLIPQDEEGKVALTFQAKESKVEVLANISQLSFYRSVVEEVLKQFLGYIAILAAIGTVSMGLLETLKWNDFIKGLTQSWLFRRHLLQPEPGAQVNFIDWIFPPTTTKLTVEDIVSATYGKCDRVRKRMFYRQGAGEIIAQTKSVCVEVINGGGKWKSLSAFIDNACSKDVKAEQANKDAEIKRRVGNLNAYFDAVLADMNSSWKFWNQLAAVVISMVIIEWALTKFFSSEQTLKTLSLTFFGGMLAPMAKDFKNSASDIISKLK